MASRLIPMTVYNNVSRSILMIDVMNLNVQLRKYTDEIRRPNNFVGYLLAFMSTSLAILTANFQDFLLPGNLWRNIFVFFDGALLVLIYFSGMALWKRKNKTPDQFIAQILENSLQENDTVITTRPY